MNLFEIKYSIQNFLDNGFDMTCIDQETGEINEERVKERLNNLEFTFDVKAENLALYIKNLKAEVTALKEEEKALNTRRKAKERKINGLTNYLANALEYMGKKKFETSKCVLSFRKSTSIEVADINKLDKEFIVEKIEYKADKKAIKEALKNEQEVIGAELIEKENLQIK